MPCRCGSVSRNSGRRGCRKVGHSSTSDEIARVFAENNERLRELLFAVIPRVEPPAGDGDHLCTKALRGARLG